MPVTTTGYGHVRLTVSDIARSRAFYDRVFGFPVAFEVPEGADEATRESLAFLFDEDGIAHAGVKDIGVASILGFRDPDGIALELIAGH